MFHCQIVLILIFGFPISKTMPSRAEDILGGFKLYFIFFLMMFQILMFYFPRNWMNLRDADSGDILWEGNTDL